MGGMCAKVKCRALSDWEIAGFGSLGLGIWEGPSGGTNHVGRTGPNEQAATATVRDDRLRRARGVAGLGIPGLQVYRQCVLV